MLITQNIYCFRDTCSSEAELFSFLLSGLQKCLQESCRPGELLCWCLSSVRDVKVLLQWYRKAHGQLSRCFTAEHWRVPSVPHQTSCFNLFRWLNTWSSEMRYFPSPPCHWKPFSDFLMGLTNLLRENYSGELCGTDRSACVHCLALLEGMGTIVETECGTRKGIAKSRKTEIEGRSRTNRKVNESPSLYSKQQKSSMEEFR